MSKNIIPFIAEKLGVAVDEEFGLKGYKEERFKFDNTLLLRYDCEDGIWLGAAYEVLGGLIYGSYEVDKLPFEPKVGDMYWTYTTAKWELVKDFWRGSVVDYAFLNSDIVFRTEKEAIAARPAKYKKLTGREWQE